jgi:hypothetical protein
MPPLDPDPPRPGSSHGRIVDMGTLWMPTGRMYCCDPFLNHEVSPMERAVMPGTYPVQLVLSPPADFGERVAAAGLIITDAVPTRWEPATCRRGRDREADFRVDAGLACFMDASTRELLNDTMDRFDARHPEGNYYDECLAAEFASSVDPARPRRAGNWAMHHPVPGDPRNVAMFASGLGDGVYAARWGLDRRGRPARLVVDFALS